MSRRIAYIFRGSAALFLGGFMRPIFDTHVHYDDDAFDEDREALIESLPAGGVAKAVDIGASIESCKKALELAHRYDHIYCALGVHPEEIGGLEDAEARAWLEDHVTDDRCVAVGEIGLDYHWEDTTPEDQQKWFLWQLDLAKRKNMPIVIHSRDAAKDTADILRSEKAGDLGGVIHCYSYTKEMAREFLDMGFYIGIGGVLTYKNAKKLVEAAEYIPMDRIVLETDGPYLAPEPVRGTRNTSLNIRYVIEKLSQIKQITEEEVREAAWNNAHALYRLQP